MSHLRLVYVNPNPRKKKTMKQIIIRVILGFITGAVVAFVGLTTYNYLTTPSDYAIPSCFVHKKLQLIIFLDKKTEKSYQGKVCNTYSCAEFTEAKEELHKVIKDEGFTQVDCENGADL